MRPRHLKTILGALGLATAVGLPLTLTAAPCYPKACRALRRPETNRQALFVIDLPPRKHR